MNDRAEIFARWHSLALIIGTRAAGKTSTHEAVQVKGGRDKTPPAPSASDWMERKELVGGMVRWLGQMGFAGEDSIVKEMHIAITEAKPREIERLLSHIDRVEWTLKVRWEKGRHRNLAYREADQYGKEERERQIVMAYRGIHTSEAAGIEGIPKESLRWIRRKHGLSLHGERMYPCTIAPRESCAVCERVNEYSDDYLTDEAA